jgi:hypothetical protein
VIIPAASRLSKPQQMLLMDTTGGQLAARAKIAAYGRWASAIRAWAVTGECEQARSPCKCPQGNRCTVRDRSSPRRRAHQWDGGAHSLDPGHLAHRCSLLIAILGAAPWDLALSFSGHKRTEPQYRSGSSQLGSFPKPRALPRRARSIRRQTGVGATQRIPKFRGKVVRAVLPSNR